MALAARRSSNTHYETRRARHPVEYVSAANTPLVGGAAAADLDQVCVRPTRGVEPLAAYLAIVISTLSRIAFRSPFGRST
jgi:hypothetical protein